MAKGQVWIDEDVQQLVSWLREREEKRGNPMPAARALNWMAREGAKAMGFVTPVAKKAVKP